MKVLIALAFVGLASMPANATEQEDQAACMSDAMTVCAQFIPDRERVGTCLVANRSRISVACRTALSRFNPSTASRAKATTLR